MREPSRTLARRGGEGVVVGTMDERDVMMMGEMNTALRGTLASELARGPLALSIFCRIAYART